MGSWSGMSSLRAGIWLWLGTMVGPFESRINFKFLILRDGLGCQAGARALGLVCGTVSSWGADVRPVLDGRIGYPSL